MLMKGARKLERYFKGAANHWRLRIIDCVARHPGITVDEISDRLSGNIKTISQHTLVLQKAGLLNKRHNARRVEQVLSPYGTRFHTFMSTF